MVRFDYLNKHFGITKMKLTPITPENLSGRYWQRYTSYSFASSTQYAPLVLAELPRAMQSLPLAFAQERGSMYLVGVLGISPGENLFVNQKGQWMGAYVPSSFRSYPFKLGKVEHNQKMVLCIDEESGLISDEQGEPFFDPNGALATPTREVMGFLKKVEQNRSVTQRAVDALAQAEVLSPWQPKVKVGDEERSIPGMLRLDEDKLSCLDNQEFLNLRKIGALPIAYAQLFSMGNIGVLKKLADFRKQEKAKVQGQTEPDLEKLFGQDDLIKFGDD
jgi:hypothetical protein